MFDEVDGLQRRWRLLWPMLSRKVKLWMQSLLRCLKLSDKGLHKEISKKKAYLDTVVQDETSQKHLLAAIETFCAALPLNASKEIALLLKVLYDAEILEEEQILLWYDAVPSGKSSANGSGAGSKAACVRKSALPFIDWLRSAEAESEEDED